MKSFKIVRRCEILYLKHDEDLANTSKRTYLQKRQLCSCEIKYG